MTDGMIHITAHTKLVSERVDNSWVIYCINCSILKTLSSYCAVFQPMIHGLCNTFQSTLILYCPLCAVIQPVSHNNDYPTKLYKHLGTSKFTPCDLILCMCTIPAMNHAQSDCTLWFTSLKSAPLMVNITP